MTARRPIAIDLFCGLGGWTDGLLAEGYDVIGFDIERHVYGDHHYPGSLALQDIRTLDGAQFAGAALIVASPPCTEYSYMAMPWRRGKQIARALRGDDEFPAGYRGSRTVADLNALFNECFRIQREAIAAAGRHVPLVVENVKGAQPWVGRSRWHYGSYHLWGDVPALMPMVGARKNSGGGSWFDNGSPGQKVVGANPVHGYKSIGLNWSDPEKRGQDFTRVAGAQARAHTDFGRKSNPHRPGGHWTNPADHDAGVKQRGSGREWFAGEGTIGRTTSSKSPARKAASAMIAKIPAPLARHVARAYKPVPADA